MHANKIKMSRCIVPLDIKRRFLSIVRLRIDMYVGRGIQLGYRPERVAMAINTRVHTTQTLQKGQKKTAGENPGEERGKRRADQGGMKRTTVQKPKRQRRPRPGRKEQGAGSREEGERRGAIVMVVVKRERRHRVYVYTAVVSYV
jgi:hypothetical protein